MDEERGKLVKQLVRTQALLWSCEGAANRGRLRLMIRTIEERIALIDRGQPLPPLPPGAPRPRPLPR